MLAHKLLRGIRLRSTATLAEVSPATHGMESKEQALQRRREERMRYEVLRMLYDATGAAEDGAVRAWSFAPDLGVWREELFRVIEFLDRKRYLEYLGAGPTVRITRAGVEYIESEAERRKSIRD